MAKSRVKIKTKGISTFIATLLLMVLAVSAGVVIYAYMMGYLGGFGGPQTMGAISVDAHNFNIAGDQLQVYVRNIGKTTFDLQSVYIDGVSVSTFTPLTLVENQVGSTTITYAAGFGTTTHLVKLVGVDNTQISFNAKGTGSTGGSTYSLTINTVGSGTVAKLPNQSSYSLGASVQLTATPVAGWVFSSWSGDLTGSANPGTVIIDTNPSVTATFILGMANPTISTEFTPTSPIVGGNVHDSATLTGATATADGSVTYTLYSGTYPGGTLFGTPSTKTVTNGVVPDSDQFTVTSAGGYYFTASYSGDANNNGDTSDPEPFTVGTTGPTLTTTPPSGAVAGVAFTDSAMLSGATSDAGGTVTYTLYNGAYPSGTPVGAPSTKAVTNGVVPNSDPFTVTSAGDYYFTASYSGDANNNAILVGTYHEDFTVGLTSSTTTTTLSQTVITLGGSVTDTATVSGSSGTPNGQVRFEYKVGVAGSWTQLGLLKDLVSGSTTSDSYLTTAEGTVYFRAIYLGDSTYAGSQSPDDAELLTVNPVPLSSITVYKDAQPNNAQSFGFTDTGLTPASFSLTDNGGVNYQTFSNLAAGTYTVVENAPPSGWSLTAINIVDPTADSTFNLGTRTATLVVAAGEDVTVTFVNKRNSDALNRIAIPGFETDSTWQESVSNLQADRADRYYNNNPRTGSRDGRTDTRDSTNNGASYAILSQSFTPILISNIPDVSNSLSLWLRNRGIVNSGVSVEVRIYSGTTMLSYIWCPSGQVPTETDTTKYIRIGDIPGTTYVNLAQNLRTDWTGKGLSISATIDRIELVSNGRQTSGTDYGQDIVWDDLQLLYFP